MPADNKTFCAINPYVYNLNSTFANISHAACLRNCITSRQFSNSHRFIYQIRSSCNFIHQLGFDFPLGCAQYNFATRASSKETEKTTSRRFPMIAANLHRKLTPAIPIIFSICVLQWDFLLNAKNCCTHRFDNPRENN